MSLHPTFWQDAEDVIFYPAYGYQERTNWIVPLLAKVQEPRHIATAFASLLGSLRDGDKNQTARLRARLADFLADDESREDVRLQYDNDSARQEYRIADSAGTFPRTDANGIVEGTLTLPDAVAARLLREQGSTDGWLTFHAVSDEHSGTGRVQLIGPTGVSVICDIDDTIKVTEVPAGPRAVVMNTFYRDFAATTELNAMFAQLESAAFHYVSGGPWQLYRPLSAFLIGGRHVPEGSFHMKRLAEHLVTPVTSLVDLARFVLPGGTRAHKLLQITRIMDRFRDRRFVLIGDSGEQDPEIYREVQTRFGSRVQEVIIRDVTNARTREPDRLSGMTIVEAPTIAVAW